MKHDIAFAGNLAGLLAGAYFVECRRCGALVGPNPGPNPIPGECPCLCQHDPNGARTDKAICPVHDAPPSSLTQKPSAQLAKLKAERDACAKRIEQIDAELDAARKMCEMVRPDVYGAIKDEAAAELRKLAEAETSLRSRGGEQRELSGHAAELLRPKQVENTWERGRIDAVAVMALWLRKKLKNADHIADEMIAKFGYGAEPKLPGDIAL